jgi:hypothetical protein
MADGAWHATQRGAATGTRLQQAATPRASLWAVCDCGGAATLDPAYWLAQGLGRHPLHALEDRVRCECGARRARLEIRGLAEAPPARRAIYVFR